MEQLPTYVSALFIATTLFTLWLLYKASGNAVKLIVICLLWLIIQAVIGLSGFYKVTTAMPPRFALLVLPPVLLIFSLFAINGGRQFLNTFSIKTLTLLHIVRVPVELTLFWLCMHKAVPAIITFEGRNFDIISGLSAPLIYYFGYVKQVIGHRVLIAWNIACLLLLANVVGTALLSAPTPLQQFAFDQPNIAILYFPFVWLPGFVVPAVLFAHLVSLRQLIIARQ